MQVGLIILFGLACLLFVAAGVLLIKLAWWVTHKIEWLIFPLVFFLTAILSGYILYQSATVNHPDPSQWVSCILFLIGGGIACFGSYYLGTNVSTESNLQAAAQVELERYRLSFEKGPQIIVIKDNEGVYLSANPAYLQFLGKKDHNLVGESDANFFPRSQATAFRQVDKQVMDGGVALTQEEELRGVDGLHWFKITRVPLFNQDNTPKGILVIGQDITILKQAEITLSGWKQGLSTLADAEVAFGDLVDQASAWDSLLSWACKLASCEHGAIWQVEPDQSAIALKIGCGKLAHANHIHLKPREGIPGKVWQNGQPVLMNDYQNWSDRGHWTREFGFTAGLGIPMKISGQVSWVMTLFSDSQGQVFREDQVQLLSLFCQLAVSSFLKNERFASSQGNLGERQQAFGKLQYRARLEHVLALIAVHFITLDPEKVDEGIERSLQTLARFASIDRCYLVLFPREGAMLVDRGWYSNDPNGSPSPKDDFTRMDFRWFIDKLNQFELIHIPRLLDLSPEDAGAAPYMQDRRIKSFTAIPLVSKRLLLGYLGFEAIQTEVEWSEDILTLMKTCGEVFVGLLERKWSARDARDALEKVNRQVHELERSNQEGVLITEMGDLLQACRTSDEAYPIVTRYVQRLIQAESGVLYMIHDVEDPAENVAEWGAVKLDAAEHELVLNECWGMRRGRLYAVQDPTGEPLCGHIKSHLKAGYICVPLLAHGVAVGLLHLRQARDPHASDLMSEHQQKLALKIAEYIAMALTNLKLRDDLRGQAIRDPLTGLFNRRYMEETLDREIRRAARHTTPVSVIMFDIDHLKPINDKYGHDCGDLLLRTVGRELLKMFRGEDVACRYGGDEFTVVLPEAALADAWVRAEQLRAAVKQLNIQYEGRPLGPLTLSVGVAAYPDHGMTAERLLLACDAASYAAKSEGRDRIIMAHKAEIEK